VQHTIATGAAAMFAGKVLATRMEWVLVLSPMWSGSWKAVRNSEDFIQRSPKCVLPGPRKRDQTACSPCRSR
jgi:hypothetical protein